MPLILDVFCSDGDRPGGLGIGIASYNCVPFGFCADNINSYATHQQTGTRHKWITNPFLFEPNCLLCATYFCLSPYLGRAHTAHQELSAGVCPFVVRDCTKRHCGETMPRLGRCALPEQAWIRLAKFLLLRPSAALATLLGFNSSSCLPTTQPLPRYSQPVSHTTHDPSGTFQNWQCVVLTCFISLHLSFVLVLPGASRPLSIARHYQTTLPNSLSPGIASQTTFASPSFFFFFFGH